MKKIIVIIFLVAASTFAAQMPVQRTVLVGSVSQGTGADSIEIHKIFTASKLALDMTSNYITVADSLRKKAIETADSNATFEILANKLKADYLIYSSVDVFHGMLRANITLVNMKTKEEKLGFGYAPLRYMKDGKKIYDVALLSALQRAFMDVTDDTTLYIHQPEQYRVKPAESMVIGGFMFDNNDNPLLWRLFTNKSVASFYASESIYSAAKEADNYAVYDLATRDSMYAAFNMYLMENFTQPSQTEMKVLSAFSVQNYIFGSIKRVENHAEVKLLLAIMDGEQLTIVSTEEGILKDDTEAKFGELIKKLTNKLLVIDNSKGVSK